jgi:hypothetical protein
VKRNAPENWRTNVKTCCCFFVRNTGMFLKWYMQRWNQKEEELDLKKNNFKSIMT